MRIKKWVSISVLLTSLAFLAVLLAPRGSAAQGNNILPNGGFEGGYFHQDDIVELAVPNNFKMHWLDNVTFSGSNGLAYRPETVVWFKGDAPVWEQELFWRDGDYNLKIFKGGAPVYAALSTNMKLVKGARYRYTVPIWVDIINGYDDKGNKIAPSDPSWGGVRLGVSEQGAEWRNGSQINYSSWFNSGNTPDFYLHMLNYQFDFTAQSNSVTLWAEMFGSQPIPNNGFFMDGLTLVQISQPATPTRVWPTKTPTPWPTKTPLPTATLIPATATATPTPTITPTPLPTGPWFKPTATPNYELTRQAEEPTPAPVVASDENVATDGGQAVAVVQPVSSSQPTEGTFVEDGVRYAVVGATDSVWSIAAKNGLTLDEILELNNLPKNEVIFIKQGDLLVVGYEEAVEEAVVAEESPAEEAASTDGETTETSTTDGETAETAEVTEANVEATSEQAVAVVTTDGGGSAETDSGDNSNSDTEAAEEATPEAAEEPAAPATVEPTATPVGAQLCLKAFDDSNQNSTHDGGEALRGNVAFTVLSGDAVISNYISDGQTETYCIRGLTPGAYRITRSKLDNETLTTGGEVAVSLTEGAVVDALFGSYIKEDVVEEVAVVDTTQADVAVNTSAEQAVEQAPEADANPMNGILIAVAVTALLLLVAILVILLSRKAK